MRSLSPRSSIVAVPTVLLAAAGVVATARPLAAADAYGTGDQILTVGAADFRGVDPVMQSVLQTDLEGYLWDYGTPVLGFNVYAAPLRLPSGASITSMCVYYYDTFPGGGGIHLFVHAAKLAPAGQPVGVLTLGDVASNFGGGFGTTCADFATPVTIQDTGDLDGDQLPEHVSYFLKAHVYKNQFGEAALGGVRITWHRQVSPPPAAATFPDVPTSHPFFQFVEALYAAGITAGYGNGNFGVNDPITRGQMAVFLSKALGLHWPD